MKKPSCAWSLADLPKKTASSPKVMTTFACGGGSSMGYRLAGCDVIAANDIDPEMAWHYKLNLNPKYYFLCPIRDLLTKELPEELFNLDILDGSPPCSTFSVSGGRESDWGKKKHFREGQAEQVLSDLFFDWLDLVDRLKPKVAIAENVKGMLLGNAKGYTKMVMNRFKEIGYSPQLFLLNSADCGVPQKRERVFFCAIRNDIEHRQLILKPKFKWISCSEAVEDLSLTEEERKETKFTANTDLIWWPRTKPGDDYGDTVVRYGLRRKLFNHKKLNGDKPASTLAATEMIKHWCEPRRMTFREWKRLGSFPDDYQAKTDKIGKYMIGMSVPPKMAQYVAEQVIRQWLNYAG